MDRLHHHAAMVSTRGAAGAVAIEDDTPEKTQRQLRQANLFGPAGFISADEIAIYSVEGQVYATDNQCSHGKARLCEGFLLDHEIECPLHQGRFDVRSGAATCEPAATPIKCYPVKVEGGRVWLQLG